jgi:hypothetical protein
LGIPINLVFVSIQFNQDGTHLVEKPAPVFLGHVAPGRGLDGALDQHFADPVNHR